MSELDEVKKKAAELQAENLAKAREEINAVLEKYGVTLRVTQNIEVALK